MPIHPKHTKEELLSRPIEELAHERWLRGLPNYRASADLPFVGDPVVELIEELLDALNYAQEVAKQIAPSNRPTPCPGYKPRAYRRLTVYRRAGQRIRGLIYAIREIHNAH